MSNGFATEQQFQAACVKWFDNEFPAERKMLHCNMNNQTDRIAGNKAMAMGVVEGVSDLEYTGWSKTCFIELKQPGKKQSPAQIDFQRKVEERGHEYIVLEFMDEFQEYIISKLTRR